MKLVWTGKVTLGGTGVIVTLGGTGGVVTLEGTGGIVTLRGTGGIVALKGLHLYCKQGAEWLVQNGNRHRPKNGLEGQWHCCWLQCNEAPARQESVAGSATGGSSR